MKEKLNLSKGKRLLRRLGIGEENNLEFSECGSRKRYRNEERRLFGCCRIIAGRRYVLCLGDMFGFYGHKMAINIVVLACWWRCIWDVCNGIAA